MPEREPDIRPAKRCTSCGKGKAEVKKLVAGPLVYLCDECIVLCNDMLRSRERRLVQEHDIQPEMHCAFCGQGKTEAKRLLAGVGTPGLCICDGCVGLCNDIIGLPPEARA